MDFLKLEIRNTTIHVRDTGLSREAVLTFGGNDANLKFEITRDLLMRSARNIRGPELPYLTNGEILRLG
jgi:hypothetical protein